MEEPGNVPEQVVHKILPSPEAEMSVEGMEEEILLVDTFLRDEPLFYGGMNEYERSKWIRIRFITFIVQFTTMIIFYALSCLQLSIVCMTI